MEEKINPITHLSEHKTKLIYNLLVTYQFYYINYEPYEDIESKTIIFNGDTFKVEINDYPIVCEIIDYIKGVKHE